MDYVYYFGYGANRDLEMIKAIIGSEPVWGKEAILQGYRLYLQSLKDIIDPKDFGQDDSFGARTRLERKWGSDFKSYIIKKDQNFSVAGTIWKFSVNDLRWVNNWELVDLGWYKIVLDFVKTISGEKYLCYIQYLTENDKSGEDVDGLHYETYVSDKQKILNIASGLRERIKKEISSSPYSFWRATLYIFPGGDFKKQVH